MSGIDPYMTTGHPDAGRIYAAELEKAKATIAQQAQMIERLRGGAQNDLKIVLENVDDICEKFEMEGLHTHPTYKQFKRLFAELKEATEQPSQYTAVDMTTAAADGFRDGAANMAEKAYLAGWNASGEGWNGEYPENASDRETWRKDRDADIESLLAPTSKEG